MFQCAHFQDEARRPKIAGMVNMHYIFESCTEANRPGESGALLFK